MSRLTSKPRPLGFQALTLSLALVLWALSPKTELWSLVVAYFAAWCFAQVLHRRMPKLDRATRIWLTGAT